jgi:2-dehydro-3-deoxygalactonokinase
MGEARFVAGDWGTSHLRLFLCDAQGVVLDGVNGPGAAEAHGRFATILASLTAPWAQSHGPLPAVLCGMVGSNLGWTQAPYVACPAQPGQIAAACVPMQEGTVAIVPGLSCHNRFNAPDFLRGEETQVLGALALVDKLREGRWVICLPGTHSKWVVVEDGWVREFFTAPTGELFGVLRDHSVLVRGSGADRPLDQAAFAKGLARFHEFPQAQLLQRLFESRSRQLSGEFTADEAAAYLSGLLVASDVHGAVSELSGFERTVVLVGTSQLTQLYASACACSGYDTCLVDGGAASLQGLLTVHRRLSPEGGGSI